MSAAGSDPAGRIAIGVVGLGRAFTLMLPTFSNDPRVKLVAATDPLASARAQFERDFQAPTFDSVALLCAQPEVQVVYIATPHQFHPEHVAIAAAHGKHILVEKPMAISLEACTRMIDAARRGGVQLIVGHSHSFDAPVLHARALIAGGEYGAVRMIHAFNYTDFLYRPRRPEELVTALGGGVIHSQAAHQIDIVRLLGGGLVQSVRAHTGAWDSTRPTEGAYSALLRFAGATFASVTYSGYGHYDSDALLDNIGEMGHAKDTSTYGSARRRLHHVAGPDDEALLKAARNYGGAGYEPPKDVRAAGHQHFGHIIVSCDRADLRITALGVEICGDDTRRIEALSVSDVPRREVIDELINCVINGQPALHNGEWSRATTEVCLAILQSASTQCDVGLMHQVSAL